MDHVIITALIVWSLAIWIYQVKQEQLAAAVWRWSIVPLLPSFRLFSEVPRAIELWIRVQSDGHEFGTWQRVSLQTRHRHCHVIWNPDFTRLQPISAAVNLIAVRAMRGQSIGQPMKIGRETAFALECVENHILSLPSASGIVSRIQWTIVDCTKIRRRLKQTTDDSLTQGERLLSAELVASVGSDRDPTLGGLPKRVVSHESSLGSVQHHVSDAMCFERAIHL